MEERAMTKSYRINQAAACLFTTPVIHNPQTACLHNPTEILPKHYKPTLGSLNALIKRGDPATSADTAAMSLM